MKSAVSRIGVVMVAGMLSAGALAVSDQDADAVLDIDDNCPAVANADQLDFDGDGLGDSCDPEAGFVFSLGRVYGDVANKGFASTLSFIGDLNGDGRDELIVGSYKDDRIIRDEAGKVIKVLRNVGSVKVISPIQNNKVLFALYGERYGDAFGYSVARIGDQNGDGIEDFAVGSPGGDFKLAQPYRVNAGSVTAFSGADGSVLFTQYGDVVGGQFGFSLDLMGDVDKSLGGDGRAHNDLLVGAPLAGALSGTGRKMGKAGKVYVVSGFDGSVLTKASGAGIGGQLGYSVAGVGDINGDGVDDFAAGAPFTNMSYTQDRIEREVKQAGWVGVYSGKNGELVHSFSRVGFWRNAQFGKAMVSLGDQNGDGLRELAIGAPNATQFGVGGLLFAGGGMVDVVEPGKPRDYGLWRHVIGAGLGALNYGQALANAGDVDGDGRDDLLVGKPGKPFLSKYRGGVPGAVYALSLAPDPVYGWLQLKKLCVWFQATTDTGSSDFDDPVYIGDTFGGAVAGRGRLVKNSVGLDVAIGGWAANGRKGYVFMGKPKIMDF